MKYPQEHRVTLDFTRYHIPMNSTLFRLNASDLVKGAVTAIFAALIFALAGAVNQTGFDVFTADWGMILGSALNAGFAAFVGYLSKNLLTDEDGKVFGKIG